MSDTVFSWEGLADHIRENDGCTDFEARAYAFSCRCYFTNTKRGDNIEELRARVGALEAELRTEKHFARQMSDDRCRLMRERRVAEGKPEIHLGSCSYSRGCEDGKRYAERWFDAPEVAADEETD